MSFRDHLLDLIGHEYAGLLDNADEDPTRYEPALLAFLDQLKLDPSADDPVHYPAAIHSAAEARECLAALEQDAHWTISDRGNTWRLERAGRNAGSSPGAGGAKIERERGATEAEPGGVTRHRFLLDFFTRLNGYPSYTDVDLAAYQPPKAPRLSCIIVLTFNDGFVLNHLIPSILNNTNVEVEIVLVNSGVSADRASLTREMKNLQVIESHFLNPATAYNRGVLHSRGEYIALFHDDCLLHDPRWFEKCLDSLDQHCIAVSPDCRPASPTFDVPKSVPMVMRRRDYLEIGGHHDALLASFEEIDFVLKILSAGKTASAVDIGCTHFKGMSSYLLFGKDLARAASWFSYLVLPQTYISALANAVVCVAMKSPLVAVLHSRGLRYVVSRYPDYFPDVDEEARSGDVPSPDLATTLSVLVEQFHRHSSHPLAARANPIKRKVLASMLARRDTESQP